MMKIRTDFVTNSSSYVSAEIVIDNLALLEILQRYKDKGLFKDSDPIFGIGNYELTNYSSFFTPGMRSDFEEPTKTPAFYYVLEESDGYDGVSLIGSCPRTLDNVLKEIISRIDMGKDHLDQPLYTQLVNELKNKADEIRGGYLYVNWYERYSEAEYEEKFSYRPETGENYEYIEDEYIEDDEDAESDEDENS